MYHSIYFGDKNSFDDWHLVPVSRPVFQPPGVKTKFIDLPGSDGSIDLTETVTGYPLYDNRSGSLDFYVMNGFDEWHQIYSDISDYLHGQVLKVVLEDDPEYYYEGRFSVNQWKSNKDYSQISIDYNVNPYKWSLRDSLGVWEFDPFQYKDYVLDESPFKNIAISTSITSRTFSRDLFGRAPVCPYFNVQTSGKSGAKISLSNSRLHIDLTKSVSEGKTQIPEFIFYGDSVVVRLQAVSGSGTVSIEFRQGRF